MSTTSICHNSVTKHAERYSCFAGNDVINNINIDSDYNQTLW